MLETIVKTIINMPTEQRILLVFGITFLIIVLCEANRRTP